MKALILILSLITTTVQAQNIDNVMQDIKVLVNKDNVEAYRPVAQSLVTYSQAHGIDYRLVLAILMTESSFRQKAISATGDFGIGQINYRIWSKEFKRLRKEPLDKKRLKADHDYAIKRTVEILSILKNEQDPQWVATYHSRTPELKQAYYERLAKQLKKMDTFQIPNFVILATNP